MQGSFGTIKFGHDVPPPARQIGEQLRDLPREGQPTSAVGVSEGTGAMTAPVHQGGRGRPQFETREEIDRIMREAPYGAQGSTRAWLRW